MLAEMLDVKVDDVLIGLFKSDLTCRLGVLKGVLNTPPTMYTVTVSKGDEKRECEFTSFQVAVGAFIYESIDGAFVMLQAHYITQFGEGEAIVNVAVFDGG